MKLSIPRASLLLGLLQKVMGVVENKQTLPILSNVLIRCAEGRLTLTATDSEIELITETDLPSPNIVQSVAFTASARKLLDICQSLADGSSIDMLYENHKLSISSGKARFSLPAMPADSFPCFEAPTIEDKFSIDSATLRRAIDQCKFAMALQDVRFYLNALMLEVDADMLRFVASDGHRLAFSEQRLTHLVNAHRQVVIPLKGVKELSRLLASFEGNVEISLGNNMLHALLDNTFFSVRLVDAKYPDFQRVIPSAIEHVIVVAKDTIKQALASVCVVCNEKFKTVRFEFGNGLLVMSATNPDNEEARDEVGIDFAGPVLDTAYNGSYIMDAINHCDSQNVCFGLTNSDSSCLIQAEGDTSSKFVVMPLRL